VPAARSVIRMMTLSSPVTDQALEGAAREISARARQLAGEIERARALPAELLGQLRASGLMRAGASRDVGALELSPGVTLRCAERIARGDASAGWCVSIAATSSLLAGYLPDRARGELFGDPEAIAAGVWAPGGTARCVEGGFVVSGRWRFCSGIAHAGVLFAGCVPDQDAGPDRLGSTPRVAAIPREQLQVLDTWHTLGLRGTGSDDAVADEVFVPAERVLSVFAGLVLDRPLYRFPIFGFFALSIAAAALGNAWGAVDDFAELAVQKVGVGSTRTLAGRSATQAAVAQAEASLRGARAALYEAVEAAWRASQRPEPLSIALRNGLRLAATHATRTSADVVRSLYDLGGATVIYDDSRLQSRFRDAFTATAHFQVNAASRELQGRVLLGQSADTAML